MANGCTRPSAAFLIENLIKAWDLRPPVFCSLLPPPEEASPCQDDVCSWSSLTDGPITTFQLVSHAGCNCEDPEEQPSPPCRRLPEAKLPVFSSAFILSLLCETWVSVYPF